MPSSAKFGLPYPVLTDAPNVPAHMQALTAAFETTGTQVLGVNVDDTDIGPNTTVIASGTPTGWPTIVSTTVTVPAGLSATRRILVIGYTQMTISAVGNVEVGIFQTDTILNFGSDPRVPNPTTSSYGSVLWGMQGAGCKTPLPAAGSVTYAVKAKNNTAGNWTSFGHSIAVILI